MNFIHVLTTKHSVQPKHVILEFHAAHIAIPGATELLNHYRNLGYQISIDHVTAGMGVLELLLQCKPDFMKFERSLWENPADDMYNMDTVTLLARTCREKGCTPLALGMEDEDQTLYLLLCGLYHHQGFYYTKDKTEKYKDDSNALNSFYNAVDHIYSRFKKMRKENIAKRREDFKLYRQITDMLSKLLEATDMHNFETILKRSVNNDPQIISGFIVDQNGNQITKRYVNTVHSNESRKITPPGLCIRTNHALKEYFLHIEAGFEQHVANITSPYTKRSSCLIANKIVPKMDEFYILCLEIACC